MARKLSPAARFAITLFALTGLSLIGTRAPAERPIKQPARPGAGRSTVVVRTATATTTAQGPQSQRPGATKYRNPFSADSQAPPRNPALLPGPLSRWRTAASPLGDPASPNPETSLGEQTPATSLTLLNEMANVNPAPALSEPTPAEPIRPLRDQTPDLPTTPGELLTVLPATPQIEPLPVAPLDSTMSVKSAILSLGATELANSAWIPLPASETHYDPGIASGQSESQSTVPGAFELPDPTQFTVPIKQPDWLTPNATRQPLSAAIGQVAFELSLHDSSRRDPTDPAPPVAESTVDIEPLIPSDSGNTPENWLAQAQEAARAAQSPEELRSISDLCQRVVNGNPPGEVDASARRLAAWAHNRRGELLTESGQATDALSDFQAAISLDPANSLAIHNRAVTLAQQNDFDAALLGFNRVIELNPGLAVAYRNRAELLCAQGKTSDAVADYSRAIDSMSDDAELYRARAHALQQLGEFERAMADLDRAIKLSPDVAQGFTQRGNLLADRGDFAGAIDDFNQAIAINPDLAETHRSLAWLKATCPDDRYRDAAQALRAAQTAVMLSSPNDYLPLDALAAAQANAGQFDKAIETQRRAINAAPPAAAEPMQPRLRLYQQKRSFRTGR